MAVVTGMNWLEITQAIAESVTALSALAAVYLFFYFRKRIPKLTILVDASEVGGAATTHVIIVVTVTNLDDGLIHSHYCRIRVRRWDDEAEEFRQDVNVYPLPSADARVPASEAKWQVPLRDKHHLWVLDKGESNTFCFAAQVPKPPPTRILVEAEYHSRRGSWLRARPYGWRRDAVFGFRRLTERP